MLKQSQLRQRNTSPIWLYGYQVPRNHREAVEIDERNGNTKWQDAEQLEISLLLEYSTFIDKGKANYVDKGVTNAPDGYKRIRCHMIYTVKHDGRHKARFVAGGHLTDLPTDSVYSGVVSLRSIRLVTFLAELNELQLWGADVVSAYLEALSKEKVYFIAGPEFGELAGHIMIIFKALYGLRSSGARFHERFSDSLRAMGFTPSKADPDVWMRPNGDTYDYIAVYVDDLLIAAKDPASIIKELREVHKYKLKCEERLVEYHLGCNFDRDPDGVLCLSPSKYIKKMLDQYKVIFGEAPTEVKSPLEKGDHPELDDTPELDENDIKKYQSLIGALQWLISLGRFDICTAVMSMSRFRIAPRKGHLQRLQRIYGYIRMYPKFAIRVRTNEPDYSDLPSQDFDWSYSVYGNVQELLPTDAPPALGKHVTLTSFVDANLYHDYITGRAVTGVLHLINQTPFDWYSKRQATVETATFGAEFVAARIAVDQVIDIRTTLRYLGVPIRGRHILFGDNQSVITNATLPHSTLQKRHNALSYHRVREAVAADIVGFYKVDGSLNPADVLSKHWGMGTAMETLRPLMYHRGDTLDLAKIPRGKGECRVFSNDVPTTSSTTVTSPTNVTDTKTIESTKVNNPYTSISTTSMSSSPMHNPTSRELWPDDCRAHVSTSPSEITGHLNKNYKYASTCRLRKELKTD